MERKKRLISVLVWTVFVFVLFSQYAFTEEAVDLTKGLPKTYDGVTLNVLMGSGAAWEAYVEISKKFTEATGIQLNFTQLNYMDTHEKMLLDVMSHGGAFDIYDFAYQWKAEIQDNLVDIEELAKRVSNAPDLALSDYHQRALDIYGKTSDGKLVGLPILGDATLLIWNKDFYKDAGLDPEIGPTSWEEIYQNGKKIMSGSSERFGFGMPAGKSIQAAVDWMLIFKAFGGEYFDDSMKPLFDSEAGIKTMKFMANELKEIGPSGIVTWDFPEMWTAFASLQVGQTMMWPGGMPTMSDPAQSQVAGRFGWTSTPGVSLLGGWATGINKDSKNQEAAYLYCAWITSPEVVKQSALIGGAPARISAFQDPKLIELYPYFPAINDAMSVAVEYPPVKEAEQIHIMIYNAVNSAVSGYKDAEQVAKDLQKEIYDMMEKQGYYK